MVLSRNYKKFKEVLLGWSTECKVGRDEASGPGREDHEGLVHSVQLFKLYPRSHGPSWRGFLQKSDTMRIWLSPFLRGVLVFGKYTHGTKGHIMKHSLHGSPVPTYQLCTSVAFRMIPLAVMWKATW